MAEYRLYCLGRNGRIARRCDFEAADDEAAIAAAREHESAAPCELWCGTRKVADLPAGTETTVAQPAK